MTKLVFLLVAFLGGSLCCGAQTEATQYFMKDLPQFTINNPAFTPAYNYSIGLPGISSAAATYTNNGFSYNDLVNHTNGTTIADLDGWKGSLTARNFITTTAQTDLLRVGFRTSEKLYFQISSTARMYSRAMLPRELTSVLIQEDNSLAGTSAQFSPKVEGTAWMETAISAAYSINKNITIGMRLKYLKGFVNATTIKSDLFVSVGEDYSVDASADAILRTSGVRDALADGYSFRKQFGNYMSNNGAAADFGMTYQITRKLKVAASVVDLGKIRWKNNAVDYVMDKATANYHFDGIDPDKLVQGDKTYLDDLAGDLRERFDFQKTPTSSYSTWIPGKVYLSASYELARRLNAGILFASEKYYGRTAQGVTMAVTKNFGSVLGTTFSYTVSNRSANNIGTGLSLNLRPFQFYVVGDNLLNYPIARLSSKDRNEYANNTQVFTCRAGLNFVWGLQKTKAERIILNTKVKLKSNAAIRARQRKK